MITGWLPPDASSYGRDIDSVFRLILYVVGAWFILAEGLLVAFVYRYRRRAGVGARHITGETARQAAWILVPAAVVLMLDLAIDNAGARAWREVKEKMPVSQLEVKVTAMQFAWVFTYPGPDGKFGTADDLTSAGKLHVPMGAVVRLDLTSLDVIHSFAVPNLRLRQDVVPGRTIPAWFKATRLGTYEIECTELCGEYHYRMRASLIVQTPAEYQAWAHKHWPAAKKSAQVDDRRLMAAAQ